MIRNKIFISILLFLLGTPVGLWAQSKVIDEVVWVVGDEAILRSDVETGILSLQSSGQTIEGDPYCVIPEQLAIQKLFLHQAQEDSITIPDADVYRRVEAQLNQWIQYAGSKEKLEEYRGLSIAQIRTQMFDQLRDMMTAEQVKGSLTKGIKVLPSDVRRYFKELPEDSIPFIPTQVEVQILTQKPSIPQDEIDDIKAKLRDYTERVNNGTATFANLARWYSEDGSASQGGELGYMGRGMLDPAFAAVAFNLQDPNKVSKIVKSEYGYHIIQLIDRKGDKINCRHILLKPKVATIDIVAAKERLDSIADDIRNNIFTFEDAVANLSDDKDTRKNHGLMALQQEDGLPTSKFRLQDLPSEVARVVSTMKVGEISKAFNMTNRQGQTVCAVVKLKNRIEGHRATITEDFPVMQQVVIADRSQKLLDEWIRDKQKTTYVRINKNWCDCQFQYPGWVK